MFDYNNTMHNVWGVLLALAVTAMLALQIDDTSIVGAAADDDERNLRLVGFITHVACLILVAGEVFIFRAETPFYSQFVVATGLVATLLEASLMADADSSIPNGAAVSEFDWFLATLFVSCAPFRISVHFLPHADALPIGALLPPRSCSASQTDSCFRKSSMRFSILLLLLKQN